MAWIDVVAGVAARRHSGRTVTTASVDELSFLNPANIDDTVVLAARVTYVGRTSMEVRVDTYVERLNGRRDPVNRAYLVMVCAGRKRRAHRSAGLAVETEEERAEWADGERRRLLRRERAPRSPEGKARSRVPRPPRRKKSPARSFVTPSSLDFAGLFPYNESV